MHVTEALHGQKLEFGRVQSILHVDPLTMLPYVSCRRFDGLDYEMKRPLSLSLI
jgi:hypothetical protein